MTSGGAAVVGGFVTTGAAVVAGVVVVGAKVVVVASVVVEAVSVEDFVVEPQPDTTSAVVSNAGARDLRRDVMSALYANETTQW